MAKNNKTIWETVLLKNVKGANFQNVKTIPDIDGALERKYQVFEVLVAETLAQIRPEVKWEITYGNKDDGIDIKGVYLSSLKTLCSSFEGSSKSAPSFKKYIADHQPEHALPLIFEKQHFIIL